MCRIPYKGHPRSSLSTFHRIPRRLRCSSSIRLRRYRPYRHSCSKRRNRHRSFLLLHSLGRFRNRYTAHHPHIRCIFRCIRGKYVRHTPSTRHRRYRQIQSTSYMSGSYRRSYRLRLHSPCRYCSLRRSLHPHSWYIFRCSPGRLLHSLNIRYHRYRRHPHSFYIRRTPSNSCPLRLRSRSRRRRHRTSRHRHSFRIYRCIPGRSAHSLSSRYHRSRLDPRSFCIHRIRSSNCPRHLHNRSRCRIRCRSHHPHSFHICRYIPGRSVHSSSIHFHRSIPAPRSFYIIRIPRSSCRLRQRSQSRSRSRYTAYRQHSFRTFRRTAYT